MREWYIVQKWQVTGRVHIKEVSLLVYSGNGTEPHWNRPSVKVSLEEATRFRRIKAIYICNSLNAALDEVEKRKGFVWKIGTIFQE